MKRIQLGKAFGSVSVGLARASKRTEETNFNRKQYGLPFLLGSIILVVAVLAPSTSQATLITYDGFNYPGLGPLSLALANGGTNWTTYWGQDFNTPTSYIITNGSLADPSALLYTSSNCVYTAGGFAGRFFATPENWGLQGATYYFSILIKPANTPVTTNFYGLQIFSNGNNTGPGGNNTGTNSDLFVGKNGQGLNWGLQYGTNVINATTQSYVNAYSTVPATANVTALLVVRVDFNFGTPDVFSLYVNPTPGGSEPATPDALLTNDIGNQDGIALNTGNGGTAFFDEIRLGSTFASVTPTNSIGDGNLLTWEPFAYIQGTGTGLLDGQPNNGTQDSNGWDNVTWGQFLGGATSYLIGQGSLADPSGKLVTSGNYTYTTNGFAGRYNCFTAPGPCGGAGGTNWNPTYYSILIRPDNLGSSNGTAFLQIFGAPTGYDLLAGKLSDTNVWGLEADTNNNLFLGQAFSTKPVVSNQTAFLVVRGNYVQGVSTFLLYVNPTPGAPEPATPDATLSFNLGTQNGLGLNVGNGAAASFDEFRVGTNYADVTPAMPLVNPFVITSVQVLNGTNPVVSFLSTTNVVYNEDQKTNLVTDAWSMIASNIPGTGGIISITNAVPPGSPMRFYRVRHQ